MGKISRNATFACLLSAGACTSDATTYGVSIGGSVQGLNGTVQLSLNGTQKYAVSSNGTFTFPTAITQGTSYVVSVIAQPTHQTCAVADGVGSSATSNITSIKITCVSVGGTAGGTTGGTTGGPAVQVYVLGGSVAGLTGQLDLQNGNDTLTVSSNGNFLLPTPIAFGGQYDVSVSLQPAGQFCQVIGGTGIIQGPAADNVSITCVAAVFSVGGSAVGLPAPLTVSFDGNSVTAPQNGNFTFPGSYPTGSQYAITLESPAPTGYACVITQSTGTIGYGNVTAPIVLCNLVAPIRQFTNPINSSAAGAPSIVRNGGYYYSVVTTSGGHGVDLLVATTLAGLSAAPHVQVLSLPTTGGTGGNCDVRNPKLVLLDSGAPSGWAIYYSATSSAATSSCLTDAAQRYPTYRTYVSLASVTDPASRGAWAGPIPLHASDGNSWSVDGVAFNANKTLYFAWSGVPTGTADGALPQALFVVPMLNANTISATRTQISTPSNAWELVDSTNAQSGVQESPAPFVHGTTTSLIFAAGSSQQNSYAAGLLYNTDGNFLNPASWTKSPQPVLTQNANAWGVGGASMFASPDGSESWVAFNSFARSNSPGFMETRAMRLTWNADGTPMFPSPVADVSLKDASNVTAAVRLCTGPNYTGACNSLPFGLYSVQALQAYGVEPNSTASAMIAGDTSAITFSLDNAAGTVKRITTNTPALATAAQFASILILPDALAPMKLVDSNSGSCMDLTADTTLGGSPLNLNACSGTDHQRVNLVSLGNGTFSIVVKSSGMCLDIAAGSNQANAGVVQRTCNSATDSQAWSLVGTAGTLFNLLNKGSQMCLTVPGGATSNNTALTQQPCASLAYQNWSVLESTFDDGGFYTLETACSGAAMAAMCVEVPNQSGSLGVPLDLQPCSAENYQNWSFVWIGLDDDGHGFYHVEQQNSGYSFDYTYGDRNTAGQVIQYNYLGAGQPHWNQNWEPSNTGAQSYRIENRDNGLMMALQNGAYSAGTLFNTGHDNQQCSQRWKLVEQ